MPALSIATQNSEPSADAAATVIDFSSRSGPQRTVQMLGDAGVFVDDDARGAVLLAKRINHGLFGDFSREELSAPLREKIQLLQQQYRSAIGSAADYGALAESGQLNQLLDEYMSFLVERSREKLTRLKEGKLAAADEKNPAILLQMIEKEQQKMNALIREQATYSHGPDYTKGMLKRVEPLVRLERYLPLGKLVIKSGLVKDAAPEAAADLVSDVLGVAAARHIRMLAGHFECVDALAAQPDSDESRVRCQAVALAVRQATQPLSSLFEFEPENAELDRIVALRTLLSAQLHRAFSEEELTQPQQMALEKAAHSLTRDYTQIALSLACHYMSEGAAQDDARVKKIQANLQREMEQAGIALIDPAEAMDKARKLARASAEDLLVAAKGDARLAGMIETLAKAAGDPVERLPLQPRAQLIGVELDDPADFTRIVTRRYLSHLQAEQERALGQTSYTHAGIIPLLMLIAGAVLLSLMRPAFATQYETDRQAVLAAFAPSHKADCLSAFGKRYRQQFSAPGELVFSDLVSQSAYDTLFWNGSSRQRGVVFAASVKDARAGSPATLMCYYALTDGGIALQSAFVVPFILSASR
jgi:hypothetical protein